GDGVVGARAEAGGGRPPVRPVRRDRAPVARQVPRAREARRARESLRAVGRDGHADARERDDRAQQRQAAHDRRQAARAAGAARQRDESRGAHYKPDFPKRADEQWLKTTIAIAGPDGPTFRYDPVDTSLLQPV